MIKTSIKRRVGVILLASAAALGNAAQASTTQDIEPATIALGEAARLTIAADGTDATSITPPMVAGLEFVAVAQAQRIESVNGISHSTTSITYQVIPRRTGVFTIPGETGAAPMVLTVKNGTHGASTSRNSLAAASPRVSSSKQSGDPTQMSANGSAFVRLQVPKHDLYVGETVPVDIQVGTRDGLVASLNGQPTLNGDAFTLDKLSEQPERAAEVIDGKPFTVFTWHGALSAVKPGDLSLTMETPLTVRIRSAARPDSGYFGEAALDDLFNDPSLQNFFGTSVERNVTVASSPASFTVQGLPTQGRPSDFSGAVGKFIVSSGLSEDKVTEGDPITLHLNVSGRGNFDRVSSPMLHDAEHWKTYAPTSTFKAQDRIGFSGEKTFDQPIIATTPGPQSLPALAFSWFDPVARRYVEVHTAALTVTVTPAIGSQGSVARGVPSEPGLPSQPGAVFAVAVAGNAGTGLRPDHAVPNSTASSRVPHYFEAPYVVAPSVLGLAFLSAGFWIRHRERFAEVLRAARDEQARLQTGPLLTRMERAMANNDVELFLGSARQAVQRVLARRWHILPSTVTVEEAKQRLGPETDVAKLFELADEAAYSKVYLTAIDFKRWKQVAIHQINEGVASS